MCSDITMCGKSTDPRGNSGTSMAISCGPAGVSAGLCGLAVLGVLDDPLAARLAGAAAMPESDLHADLVLPHQVLADRAADVGDDVALGGDTLGFLDRVGHGGWGSLRTAAALIVPGVGVPFAANVSSLCRAARSHCRHPGRDRARHPDHLRVRQPRGGEQPYHSGPTHLRDPAAR